MHRFDLGAGSRKKYRTTKKSQKCYISPIWGKLPLDWLQSLKLAVCDVIVGPIVINVKIFCVIAKDLYFFGTPCTVADLEGAHPAPPPCCSNPNMCTVEKYATGSALALHCCKARAKINRKIENSTPFKIVTHEDFNLKLGTRDYIVDITHQATFGSNRSSGGFPQTGEI